jgi:valyl-tRNA synthetase
MDKAYDHKKTEHLIYEKWLKSGYFKPENLPNAKKRQPYTIIMPPPNVTGTLHIGHALFVTIQDILIRWRRMQGKKTLWLPGTDHAAIATQAKVEADLYKKEGKTKLDYGREEFLKLVEDFAQNSHDTIINQLKRIGASCDWSREAYTLDQQRNLAVRTAFKRMYDEGIVYRGHRIVNWDPKLQTTVSDDEIEWKEETVPLYYLKYGPFVIATARPETKFGDKYVVMHPNDKRYQQYKHGDKIHLEWINGPVIATIIKDAVIDMEFGTGAMTITPWHDTVDFEIAQRHQLDAEQIIDERGLLLPIAGEFAGLHIKKARPLIVGKLKTKGLVEKVDENYSHRIAFNSRGGGLIEPQIKEQWFVDVNKKIKLKESKLKNIKSGQETSLKELMRSVVESGEIKIIPDHFAKIYFHWIDNLRDWCISRQIWYGHRIPVWCCDQFAHDASIKNHPKLNEPVHVGEPIEQCPYCGFKVTQDPDTLDTWFSSGLWTFSTLGWPDEKSKDLLTYHPTDVLETAYDILFFWVARMILMTTYHLGDIPFRYVYLHGLVRDKDRQKMSKSKGNVIDPLGVIDLYGTDALRFALVFNTTPGTDLPLSEDKIRGMKYFANKLWNIARFIITNLETTGYRVQGTKTSPFPLPPSPSTDADKDILAKLNQTIKSVTDNLETFRLHEAAQEIYQFVWHEFADIYIEESKKQLKIKDQEDNTKKILAYSLFTILKLLHPFMPFVTEEIWSKLKQKDLLMVADWPA